MFVHVGCFWMIDVQMRCGNPTDICTSDFGFCDEPFDDMLADALSGQMSLALEGSYGQACRYDTLVQLEWVEPLAMVTGAFDDVRFH